MVSRKNTPRTVRGAGAGPQVPARRSPTQARARETVAAILQAAAELFARLGYAHTTTNKVAARAGVSIGSLYQYFPNKDALFLALLERHRREVRGVVEPAFRLLDDPDTPLAVGLRRLLDGLVELHAKDPELNRVLGEALPVGAPESSTASESTSAELVARVNASGGHGIEGQFDRVERMLRRRKEVRVRDHRIAAILLTRSIESLTRWLVHSAPKEIDQRTFVRELECMLLRYLIEDG
jgi:AcrR family transcriptional regulator